jgi:hypothetical protein
MTAAGNEGTVDVLVAEDSRTQAELLRGLL